MLIFLLQGETVYAGFNNQDVETTGKLAAMQTIPNFFIMSTFPNLPI